MPRRHCSSCRTSLHADDGHSECISCLGKSHTEAALTEMDCSHCVNMSLTSLHAQIAFFSESDSAPHALLFSSSQGPVRKKTAGHRDSALCCDASPRRFRPCVPRPRHAEMTLPSSLNTSTSIPRLMRVAWFHSVEWRTNCLMTSCL